jgi:predicted transcriptional regulator
MAISSKERLKQVSEDLKAGKPSPSITTRTFLAWFGAQRRGYNIVRLIRFRLKEAGLVTVPDFESAYIDSDIRFAVPKRIDLKKPESVQISAVRTVIENPESDPAKDAAQDPTYRVSKLAAANQPVKSVKPDSLLSEAVTALMAFDFSQLPVMTSEREVKGVISWKSIGERVGLGVTGVAVRDFMDMHDEVPHSASMFEAIPIIIAKDYVLVRADDKTISGIITAADLSLQFMILSEPFLLLSEIENLLRSMIDGRFSVLELKSACDPSDDKREVESVADLTFGEYIRLLENEERWGKFDLPIDRAMFCKKLDEIRRIRNDVMHFDPDGISDEDLNALRDFARFIKRIATLRPGRKMKA